MLRKEERERNDVNQRCERLQMKESSKSSLWRMNRINCEWNGTKEVPRGWIRRCCISKKLLIEGIVRSVYKESVNISHLKWLKCLFVLMSMWILLFCNFYKTDHEFTQFICITGKCVDVPCYPPSFCLCAIFWLLFDSAFVCDSACDLKRYCVSWVPMLGDRFAFMICENEWNLICNWELTESVPDLIFFFLLKRLTHPPWSTCDSVIWWSLHSTSSSPSGLHAN